MQPSSYILNIPVQIKIFFSISMSQHLLARSDESAVRVSAVVGAAVLGVGGGQEVDVEAPRREEAPRLGHVESEVVGLTESKMRSYLCCRAL